MLGLEGDRKGVIIEDAKKYLREVWKRRNTKEKRGEILVQMNIIKSNKKK